MHHFSNSDLELAQITKAQSQDIFNDHKQSLYQFLSSSHRPLQV